MSVAVLLLATVLAADGAAKPAPAGPGKLPPEVAKEMTESIVAVNKALGLESWPSHGATPCVDRGGQGITAKSIGPEETRKCATTAIEKNFPGLGKSYVLAIPMVALGPVTVIALGIGDNADWGAHSCDPQRKCNPVKLSVPSQVGQARGRAAREGVRRGDDALVSGRPEGVRRDGHRFRRPEVDRKPALRGAEQLADEGAGVAEHAHPRAVLAPLARVPGVLHGAEHALGVRHDDGDAAVAAW